MKDSQIERQTELTSIFRRLRFPTSRNGGVTRQEKMPRKLRRPARFDELKIKFFVRPINLVADDRVA